MVQFESTCWNSDDDGRCSDYLLWTKFPDSALLQEMRKPLRKRKIPIFLEKNGNHEQIGSYSVSDHEDPICSWSVVGGLEKSFTLSELCKNPDREADRYEFGMLVSSFCDNFANIIRRIHGDSIEVLAYQSKCFRVAKNFKHWATVRANQMIFVK